MKKIQIKFINDAMDDSVELAEWEYDFINDVADKDESYVLSDKQNAILNRISQKLQE